MKRVTLHKHREQEHWSPLPCLPVLHHAHGHPVRGINVLPNEIFEHYERFHQEVLEQQNTVRLGQCNTLEFLRDERGKRGGSTLLPVKSRELLVISVNLRLEPKSCRTAVSDSKWKLKATTLKSLCRAFWKIEGINEWKEKVALLLSKV